MIYGQSHLDRDFVVPMEAVQQIEVVRGPGSSLYGTNAVFGVINVVTKNGSDVNGIQVKVEGGTQETGRASILYGMELPGGWDVLASSLPMTRKATATLSMMAFTTPPTITDTFATTTPKALDRR